MIMISKKRLYDAKARSYPEEDPESIFRYRRALAFVPVPCGSPVLDVGCKLAILRELLREVDPAAEYFGVDISVEVLRRIQDTDDVHFKVADASQGLPFADDTFESIFALEVLEHVENPTRALSECKRVLAPGGQIVLSVPNPYSWNEIYGNLRGAAEDQGHISAWTPQLMDTLTRLSGFTVVKRKGTFMRIPFSRRFRGEHYWLLPTDNLFLARSFIYYLQAV